VVVALNDAANGELNFLRLRLFLRVRHGKRYIRVRAQTRARVEKLGATCFANRLQSMNEFHVTFD